MNKHSHVRSFLSVVTRPRAEPAVNDFPVVAWKAAEGKLRLLSLMCIYCGCLKLVASQCAICRAILPGVQPGNGLEPVRDILSVLYCIITYYNIYCIILYIYIYIHLHILIQPRLVVHSRAFSFKTFVYYELEHQQQLQKCG